MWCGTLALINFGFLDGSARGTGLGERFTESGEHRAADRLLLHAEVIFTTNGRYGPDFCASLNSVACLSIANTLSEGPTILSTIACSSSPPIGLI